MEDLVLGIIFTLHEFKSDLHELTSDWHEIKSEFRSKKGKKEGEDGVRPPLFSVGLVLFFLLSGLTDAAGALGVERLEIVL